jgi:hypothetical protein
MYSSCREGTPVPRLASGLLKPALAINNTPTSASLLPTASSTPPALAGYPDHRPRRRRRHHHHARTSLPTTGRCSVPPSLECLVLFLSTLSSSHITTAHDPCTWDEKAQQRQSDAQSLSRQQASHPHIYTIAPAYTTAHKSPHIYCPHPCPHPYTTPNIAIPFQCKPYLHLYIYAYPRLSMPTTYYTTVLANFSLF